MMMGRVYCCSVVVVVTQGLPAREKIRATRERDTGLSAPCVTRSGIVKDVIGRAKYPSSKNLVLIVPVRNAAQ